MNGNSNMHYKKCYVAFIDILGFKEYVKNNSCEAVHTVLSYLEVEAVANPYGIKMKYGIDVRDIKILCISDSVIISIEESIPHALEAIIWLCAAFQLALLLNARLLMRGGISYGDFYASDSMKTGNTVLFGQAYNNAVDLEKSNECGKRPVIIIDKNIKIDDVISYPFLSWDNEYEQIFVDYMHKVTNAGAFNIKMRFVAKEIVSRIKEYEDDERTRAKYVWTKSYITNSLNDESVFSKENISLCEIDQRPLNLKVVFIEQEANNGQTSNGNP